MKFIPEPSFDETYFVLSGKKVFDKTFQKVLPFQERFAAVQDENGWFHINEKGKECYPDRYEKAFSFYCSRSTVVKSSKWFHLTDQFVPSYTDVFSWCGNYMENVCTVKKQESYFHIDLYGKPIYKSTYKYVGDFYEGIASVQLEDGSFRHIKKDGNFLHSLSASFLGVYHKGYAIAKDKTGWYAIDKKGKELFNERYLYLEPFYNGKALAMNLNGETLFIESPSN